MSTSTTARPSTVPGRGRLPAPVRDRRPALAALALLLVLAGALGSALIAYRSGDRIDVLVAAREIPVGSTVTDADFDIARVAADSTNRVVAADARANFVGTRTTTTVPAGTLVNSQMFRAGSVIPSGGEVVGVVLSSVQRPVDLTTGDVVRVFGVGAGVGAQAVSTVLADAVRVIEVSGGDGDGFKVSLLLPADLAGDVVAAASASQVAVARLAAETEPVLDFVPIAETG